eukprot:1138475-Pelagomonas_calceolata.AAC.6
MPPSPWTGSTNTAAVLPFWMTCGGVCTESSRSTTSEAQRTYKHASSGQKHCPLKVKKASKKVEVSDYENGGTACKQTGPDAAHAERAGTRTVHGFRC